MNSIPCIPILLTSSKTPLFPLQPPQTSLIEHIHTQLSLHSIHTFNGNTQLHREPLNILPSTFLVPNHLRRTTPAVHTYTNYKSANGEAFTNEIEQSIRTTREYSHHRHKRWCALLTQ
ncbi:hypothetical protein SK128_025568 [Halocaridina rubra]|uniref:Uncharacterized protein n=1 Tax=Halocaridina rubra TaxID=373956 RepID=A0AAN8X668_HALRR